MSKKKDCCWPTRTARDIQNSIIDLCITSWWGFSRLSSALFQRVPLPRYACAYVRNPVLYSVTKIRNRHQSHEIKLHRF